MSADTAYDDQHSRRYHHCQAIFERWYPGFKDAGIRYQEMIASLVTEESRVLDLGCGRMTLAAAVLAGRRNTFGVDLAPDDLRHNETMRYRVAASGEALPFAPSEFDLVISQWVLEHLERPAETFREVARVLRPGGSAVLFTTNDWNYVPLAGRLLPEKMQRLLAGRLLRRPAHETHPAYYRANTHRRLASLVRDSGLSLDEYLYVGNPFYLAFSPLLFYLALVFEKVTDVAPLQRFKLYLLVRLSKPADQNGARR